ncbi:Imm21 family immunity protein [Luteibacter sp.]|uniref:Imm21 family immunity protein n=1 Tax=Luteibacter sp. TaxID=1886636 RepID=UPI003F7E95B8
MSVSGHASPLWISSKGGPLVLMHRSLLGTWQGASGNGRGHGFPTDYAWACAVEAEVDVCGGLPQILVLGDEPDATSVRHMGGDVVLVRWRAAPSAEAMEAALLRSIASLPFTTVARFTTHRGDHVLFEAADVGWGANPAVTITLDGTSYDVANAVLTDDEGTSALLHRLARVA